MLFLLGAYSQLAQMTHPYPVHRSGCSLVSSTTPRTTELLFTNSTNYTLGMMQQPITDILKSSVTELSQTFSWAVSMALTEDWLRRETGSKVASLSSRFAPTLSEIISGGGVSLTACRSSRTG